MEGEGSVEGSVVGVALAELEVVVMSEREYWKQSNEMSYFLVPSPLAMEPSPNDLTKYYILLYPITMHVSEYC